jgi:hypothetical protein
MRKLMIAALVAAPITTAAPAAAAEIVGSEAAGSRSSGAFVGGRLRVPLRQERRAPRAALTVAPTTHSDHRGGERRIAVGEGVELAVSRGDKPRLMLAGAPMPSLAAKGSGPGGRKLGMSTTGWLAIGVGVVVVVVGGLYIWADSSCGDECDG